MLDQLLLQATTTLTNATVITAPIVAQASNSLVDLINQIVQQFGSILIIISALLATPGGVAFFNLIKRNKERQAAQELTGIYGQKLQSMEQQIKVLAQFMYSITPKEQRDKMDELGQPILTNLEEKIAAFELELQRLKGSLPTTTRAALTKV